MKAFLAAHLHDPEHAALRKATRIAILITVVMGVGKALDVETYPLLFAAFAVIAVGGLADFGGPPRPRAAAYLITTAACAVLIAIGTLVSESTLASVLVTLVIAFGVAFLRLFGGAFVPGQMPLQLALVLAISLPGSIDEAPARMAGWLVGGLVCTVAALTMWPHFEALRLRKAAADALQALAAHVREGVDAAVFRAKAEAYRTLLHTCSLRPSGPSARAHAMWVLGGDMMRATELVPLVAPLAHDPAEEQTRALEDAGAGTLEDAVAALRGERTELSVTALDTTRDAHRQAMTRWAGAELDAGTDADALIDTLENSRARRMLSYLIGELAGDAAVISGVPDPVPDDGRRRSFFSLPALLRVHLAPSSIWFRDSLRIAGGLAAAVLLTKVTDLSHGFWVILGVLSVLRSNALSTGRVAGQAFLGTVLGFAVCAPFILVVGDAEVALWIALPITTFLTLFAPTALSFVIGQASFTSCVIVLFNLVVPTGWTIGLVRVEDIGIGVCVGILAGLVLWPRGASGQVIKALGAELRAAADYIDVALRASFGEKPDADPDQTRRRVLTYKARAEEVFETFRRERAPNAGDEGWNDLLIASRRLSLYGDVLIYLASLGYHADGASEHAAVAERDARRASGEFRSLANALDSGGDLPPPSPPEAPAIRRRASAAELSAAKGGDVTQAIALVYIGDWTGVISKLADDLRPTVAALTEGHSKPFFLAAQPLKPSST